MPRKNTNEPKISKKIKEMRLVHRKIFGNQVPRQILGLLLKYELSPTELAEKIYGKKNVRTGILKWLKYLDEKGWIYGTSSMFSKKHLFKAKLKILGDFDKEEEKFVKLFIERFWNPKARDLVMSINEFLLEALFIKKIYEAKKEDILGYYPKKDLEEYNKNKDKFWNEEKFRNNLLDKILKKGEEKLNKKGFSELYIKRDFIFLSTLIPESIFDKLNPDYRHMGSPIYTAVTILDSYNKEKKYQCSECSHQFNELKHIVNSKGETLNICPNCETELKEKIKKSNI